MDCAASITGGYGKIWRKELFSIARGFSRTSRDGGLPLSIQRCYRGDDGETTKEKERSAEDLATKRQRKRVAQDQFKTGRTAW